MRTERCAALRATGRGRGGGAGAPGRAAGHGARRCEPEAALLCNDPRAPEAFVGALTLPRKRWSGRCRRPRAALSCPRCPPRRANCARSKTAPRPSPRAPAPPGAPCARARATSPRGRNQSPGVAPAPHPVNASSTGVSPSAATVTLSDTERVAASQRPPFLPGEGLFPRGGDTA